MVVLADCAEAVLANTNAAAAAYRNRYARTNGMNVLPCSVSVSAVPLAVASSHRTGRQSGSLRWTLRDHTYRTAGKMFILSYKGDAPLSILPNRLSPTIRQEKAHQCRSIVRKCTS